MARSEDPTPPVAEDPAYYRLFNGLLSCCHVVLETNNATDLFRTKAETPKRQALGPTAMQSGVADLAVDLAAASADAGCTPPPPKKK